MIRKRAAPHKKLPLKRLMLATVIICFILSIAYVLLFYNRVDFDNLTVSQLQSADYYAYLLPSADARELGWDYHLWMISFDWHCIRSNDSRVGRWNPIYITYANDQGEYIFGLRMSPDDALFDDYGTVFQVETSADWVPSGVGVYYEVDDWLNIKFVDTVGIEVVASSNMSLDAMLSIIDELEFVGDAGNSDPYNPWDENC